MLAVLVVLGVCTTLLALCLYLYWQNRKLYRIIRWVHCRLRIALARILLSTIVHKKLFLNILTQT